LYSNGHLFYDRHDKVKELIDDNIPVITILASALMARKITGTWLSPGSFFTISWSFFLIVPLLFAPEFKVDLLGIWFIAILSMACAAGSVIAYKPPSIDYRGI
jgi:hypothetical protein